MRMFYVNGIFDDLIDPSGLLLRSADLYEIRGGVGMLEVDLPLWDYLYRIVYSTGSRVLLVVAGRARSCPRQGRQSNLYPSTLFSAEILYPVCRMAGLGIPLGAVRRGTSELPSQYSMAPLNNQD